MRTQITVGTGALAVGLLLLSLMSSPVYGQPRNADTPKRWRDSHLDCCRRDY